MIIGIDPGLTGALAVLTMFGDLREVHDLPVTARMSGRGNEINARQLLEILKRYRSKPDVWIERIHSSPQMGVTGAFNFGDTNGVIRACAAAIGAPVHFVTPRVWKRMFQMERKHKDFARTKAMNLYPTSTKYLTRKKDVGRADAILIAAYGQLQETGEIRP